MSRLYTALAGFLCFLFSLTAPFAVPIALLFTRRDAKNLAWSWYDTPDEPQLMDLSFPAMKDVYDRWGWFLAAWYWFGVRNRAHGFTSALFAKEAPMHWPELEGTTMRRSDGFFLRRTRFGVFLFVFGWQVYRSAKFATGLEYRPMLSIKHRRLVQGVSP